MAHLKGRIAHGCPDIAIAVKLIDAQFPPYDQVIPRDHKKIITVDRLRLIDTLPGAQLMSSETRGVKIAVTRHGVTITSDNPDLGEVREERVPRSATSGSLEQEPEPSRFARSSLLDGS